MCRYAWVMGLMVALMALAAAGCGRSASTPELADGAKLYAAKCAACHGDRGEGRGRTGTALNNQDFLAIADDDFLFRTIAEGRPGTQMPVWSVAKGSTLSDGQIKALVDYIRSWQTTDSVDVRGIVVQGDPERGKLIYAAQCAECHGSSGQGGEGPALGNQAFLATTSDGFLRASIEDGRSGTAMPAFGQGRGGNLTDQELDDVVAFIRRWQDGGGR